MLLQSKDATHLSLHGSILKSAKTVTFTISTSIISKVLTVFILLIDIFIWTGRAVIVLRNPQYSEDQ